MAKDDEGFMYADEFKQTYGYDPTEYLPPDQQQPQKPKVDPTDRGFLARYGGNLAVGAGTAYPSWAALPETAIAGAQALYNSMGTDKSFMDAFTESMQVEGAQKNIIDHLNAYGQRLRQENPGASDDALYAKLEEYKASKEFEHFTHTQLRGGVGLAAGVEDVAHAAVGDTRTEAQKDWTDTASEILGSALVGGPAGIPAKIGRAAAKNVVSRALLNNPVSRTAIKAVELTTPVTIPYTAPNVIANAAVGTVLDQSLRFAQGKDTAFTPKDEGAGPGTLVAGLYGVAGAAAFVAAMHGRSTSALSKNLNDAAKAVEKSPKLKEQITGGGVSEPTIVSGREQQLNPESAIDEAALGGTLVRARQNAFDEGSPLLKYTAEARPDVNWREIEATFRQTTGPVLEDAVHQATDVAMHDVYTYARAVQPQNRAAVDAGMLMSTLNARYRRVEDVLLTKIENYEASGKPLKGNKGYEKAVDDLQRLQNDKDATARLALPDTPRSEVSRLAHIYETSTSEDIVRVRNAHEKWADLMIHNEVLSNRMSGEYGATLRRLDKYFVPFKSDPLGGAMGVERVRRIAVRSVKRAQTTDTQGTGGALARESPIRQFKAEVPLKTANRKQETRITAAMHPIAAMHEYTLDSYRSMAKEISRFQFTEWLSKGADKKVSQFVKDGHMVSVPNPRTGRHWTPAEKVYGNEDLLKLMNDDLHVPVWHNGEMRLWKFGDRELALALRHDPVKISGLMQNVHTFSDWFKFFTTGAGNPIFSVKGALYNIVMGMFLRRGDRAYGSLSYAIHRFFPKPVARVLRVMTLDFDPTVLLTAPYHTLASITEFMVWAGARKMADKLKTMPEFNALRQSMGEVRYQAMVKRAVSIAAWTENFATLKMMRGGATHGIRSIDPIANVHKSYSMLGEMMPQSMKGAYSFYKGLLDSIYLGGSRPYYTQNRALLAKKWGGADKIPQNELTQLMHETRTIGGDMSLVAANESVRNIESALPYMVQAKLGAYHLVRNAFGKETGYYVIPRLFMGASAVGMSFYWRTYWNEESRTEFWKRRPEYDRYRIIDIPTPQLLWAWANGENPAYNRNLYYSITLPPDLVGIVAGAAAIMQEMGMFPQDATPRPIRWDIPNLIINSMTPAMPPLLQAFLAQSGAKFDPQSSEARGGNWLRVGGNQFRAGPQAESLSNLGQVSNSTALIMNSLFGAMGSHLAASTDILLHAAKFQTSAEVDGKTRVTERDQRDYIHGLSVATGALVERATQQMPDVPLLWQNKERYRVTTPAWQFVAENNTNIRSIVGSRNAAIGKAEERKRALATGAGGIPERAVTDQVLIAVMNDVNGFQTTTGPLGQLRKKGNDLRTESRGIVANYSLPQDQKQELLNAKVRQQQNNMEQQHLAVKYLEQYIAQKYGQQLAPRLQGRAITMPTLDAMIRENFNINTPPPLEAAAAQE